MFIESPKPKSTRGLLLGLCSLLFIPACGADKDDCRPDIHQSDSVDPSLLQLLVGKTYYLQSYRLDGGDPIPAIKGPMNSEAFVSFHNDGTFSAHSSVNKISPTPRPGINRPTGRYFVHNATLNFCGTVGSGQMQGATPMLKQQQLAFRRIVFVSPEISTQGDNLVLTVGQDSLLLRPFAARANSTQSSS